MDTSLDRENLGLLASPGWTTSGHGIWVTGDQLAPPRRARSVRVRDGKAIVTDGPFAETKEAVGGFDILECGSLEEAVEIAREHPFPKMGTIEVRPLWGN